MLQQFPSELLCGTNFDNLLLHKADKVELCASRNKSHFFWKHFLDRFLIVNFFSLALDLSLNPEITKPSSNKVSLSRFLRNVFTFGEGRSITSLIHPFSVFFDWVCLVFSYGCDLLCLWTGRLRLKKLARLL